MNDWINKNDILNIENNNDNMLNMKKQIQKFKMIMIICFNLTKYKIEKW